MNTNKPVEISIKALEYLSNYKGDFYLPIWSKKNILGEEQIPPTRYAALIIPEKNSLKKSKTIIGPVSGATLSGAISNLHEFINNKSFRDEPEPQRNENLSFNGEIIFNHLDNIILSNYGLIKKIGVGEKQIMPETNYFRLALEPVPGEESDIKNYKEFPLPAPTLSENYILLARRGVEHHHAAKKHILREDMDKIYARHLFQNL